MTRQTLWQTHTQTTLQTAKQIIRSNYKVEWLNEWAMGNTGRTLFKYMTTPKANDEIDKLSRKDQATIFRLRTQHIPLNQHLNRIGVIAEKACPLCDHPEETVEHHLFHCPRLSDLRTQLLPPLPDIHNTLFCKHTQLKNTCTYHYMSLTRRAKAHELLVR